MNARTLRLWIVAVMILASGSLAQESCKYLVNVTTLVAEEQAPFAGDPQEWLPSAAWQAKINALTHEVQDPPGGVIRQGDFYDELGVPLWKIVNAAWEARPSADITAARIVKADLARRVRLAHIGASIGYCTTQGSAFDAAKAELQAAYDKIAAALGTGSP